MVGMEKDPSGESEPEQGQEASMRGSLQGRGGFRTKGEEEMGNLVIHKRGIK